MNKLLDKVIDINATSTKRRCILTKEKYSWVLITGPADSTEEYMISNGDRYFYSDIQAFLTSLLFKRFRALVDDWDEDRLIDHIEIAKTEVIEVAHEVEANMKGLLIYESS